MRRFRLWLSKLFLPAGYKITDLRLKPPFKPYQIEINRIVDSEQLQRKERVVDANKRSRAPMALVVDAPEENS